MQLNLDFLRQLATVDGLLAGFALAAAARLITERRRSWAIAVSRTSLLVASIVFLTDCFLAVVLIGLPELDVLPPAVLTLTSLFEFLSLVALVPFLVGIGAIAWIPSKRTGLVVSLLGLASLGLIIWAWLATP